MGQIKGEKRKLRKGIERTQETEMSRGEMMVRWSSDSAEKYRAAMSGHVIPSHLPPVMPCLVTSIHSILFLSCHADVTPRQTHRTATRTTSPTA